MHSISKIFRLSQFADFFSCFTYFYVIAYIAKDWNTRDISRQLLIGFATRVDFQLLQIHYSSATAQRLYFKHL